MQKAEQDTKDAAYAAFAAKLKWLREREGLSQTGLERAMKKRGLSVSQKSVSNIERIEHDSQISNFAAIAAHFGVPLWVMFVPGLSTELLEGERPRRLTKLVQDYLSLDDEERRHVENMAAGFAKLRSAK